MLALLADENFRHQILEGLVRRVGDLDIVTAEDLGLRNTSDEVILARAAAANRILMTHDERTMRGPAYNRLESDPGSPAVVLVPWTMSVGRAIEELVVVLGSSRPEELVDRVIELPVKQI